MERALRMSARSSQQSCAAVESRMTQSRASNRDLPQLYLSVSILVPARTACYLSLAVFTP